MDAVTKLCRFKKAATASIKQARSDMYLGQPQREVQLLAEKEQLSIAGVMAHTSAMELPHTSEQAARAAGQHHSHQGDEEERCANLHCSRPTVDNTDSTACDQHGLVGGVCSHGIPLLGLFTWMCTPEQFAFYLLLLLAFAMNLMAHGIPAADVYIDFGCRIKATWHRYLASRCSSVQQACSKLRIMVNWMHAAGHSWDCQMKNSGRFITGAAWRVGEQIEQLWSLFKVRLTHVLLLLLLC